MHVIHERNVQGAFPTAIQYLFRKGIQRTSRNGLVLQAPGPVSTVYTHPTERVIYWPQRDANPFFHLYEALWMLAGRRDVAGPVRYAKNMANYSDDGEIFHGAYGDRWRKHFVRDQLITIAKRLKENPEDRRCILQMWDGPVDLGYDGKDAPCNTIATFQRDSMGKLDLVVFCRSNDIVWGCYGANAVHFSFLLEYMALWIGCRIGTMTQVSVNWHGYRETVDKYQEVGFGFYNPYLSDEVRPDQMFHGEVEDADNRITKLLLLCDMGFNISGVEWADDEPFFNAAYGILRAHALWKAGGKQEAIDSLGTLDLKNDWVMAAYDWFGRRKEW